MARDPRAFFGVAKRREDPGDGISSGESPLASEPWPSRPMAKCSVAIRPTGKKDQQTILKQVDTLSRA